RLLLSLTCMLIPDVLPTLRVRKPRPQRRTLKSSSSRINRRLMYKRGMHASNVYGAHVRYVGIASSRKPGSRQLILASVSIDHRLIVAGKHVVQDKLVV